ncbi:hypothetical protein HT797_003227 [Salmonella enterica]|jgi:hypothetical protein|nr:hypothetical protein [Salmonella enterica]EFU5460792.1 hypothetical protein [Salmonella enterica]
MSWDVSAAALRLHDAAYRIELAWEDEQPVSREMCMRYHQALDAAMGSMPAERFQVEASRLRSWLASGAIPQAGKSWADAIVDSLEKGPQR